MLASADRFSPGSCPLSPASYSAIALCWSRNGSGIATLRTRIARDLVLAQGDIIEIGDAAFKFHVTPGHTPGCLTIEDIVYDHRTPHRALSP